MKLTLLIVVCILSLISPAMALESLILAPELGEQSLAPHLEMYQDPTQKLEIEDVIRQDFQATHSDTPNMGFSQDAYWLRFKVSNPGDHDLERLLEVGHPNIDQVWFYRSQDQGFESFKTGRQVPFKQRDVLHRNFVFPLHIPAHSSREFYIRVHSTSAYYVPLSLSSPLAFALRERKLQLGFGFYYGLIFVMVFYNLVLWLSTRDRNYLYYVSVLVVLHGLFQLTVNGLGYEYIWPNSVWWNNHCLGFLLGLSTFLVIHFSQSFLNTAKQLHYPHRFLNLLKYLGLSLGILNFFPDQSWPAQLSVLFNNPVALITMPVILITALIIWRKGDQAARYFLIAWSSLLLGGLITGLTTYHVFETSFWTTYALQIGTGLEVVLLSLALGDRLRRNQEKMLAVQQAHLEQERKATAAQEQMITRLQKLDRLKDEFIANISHELRTPLNGIIGISESMVDGATGQISPEQSYNLSLVISSARRLFHLVSDLIDFSQIKHREIKLNPRPVWLREVVGVVLKLSQPLIGNKEIKLINQIPAEFPPIAADEDRLQQILHNLLGNAIKFTPAGQVSVSARLQGQQALISVSDSGIGISEEAMPRIFESFEQADGSITREYSGSGLGLTITRQLVELHGGEIQVESDINNGTSFTFSLPLADQTQVSKRRSKAGPAAFRGQTQELALAAEAQIAAQFQDQDFTDRTFHILVVDDEPVNLQVLVNMLALQKYTVTRAQSGAEALKALQKRPFDLVLLDVMMPHMSGYQVCEEIRLRYPASELPIVFLTARNQVEDLVQGFETGANDYLTKPVAKNELLARIQTHIHLSKINLSYARFVPDEFLRFLGHDNILQVQLGDQVQQEMTVMFSDIREFTSLSETLTPKENFDFLNDYLSRISPVIRINKGFIDKYIGDGVMALFPHQAQDALDAAMEMCKELASYNQERADLGYREVKIGIGLHTGMLMLGTIGESERMEGTVISDAVNTAARMEGLTKLYGCSLIISEQTYQELSDPEKYALRYLGQVRVKGKSQHIKIYEVLEDNLSPDYNLRYRMQDEFEEGVTTYFNREIEAALEHFQRVLEVNSDDLPAQYYAQRCTRYLGMDHLPEDVAPSFV